MNVAQQSPPPGKTRKQPITIRPAQVLGPAGYCSLIALLDAEDPVPILSNGQWLITRQDAHELAKQVIGIWVATIRSQLKSRQISLRDLNLSELEIYFTLLRGGTGRCVYYAGADLYHANFDPDKTQSSKIYAEFFAVDNAPQLIRRPLRVASGAVLNEEGHLEIVGWTMPLPHLGKIWIWAEYLALAFQLGGTNMEHAVGSKAVVIKNGSGQPVMAVALCRPTTVIDD